VAVLAYNVSKESVFSFLRSQEYHVPTIQRRYSWGREDADRLWEDIKSFHEDGNQKFYLLHTVITVADDQEGSMKRLILDGQQRTTTILAMLSAFVALVDKHDSSGAFAGQRTVISNILNDKGAHRLTTDHDADRANLAFLQSTTIGEGRSAPERAKRVFRNYNHFLTACFEPTIEELGVEAGLAEIYAVLHRMLHDCNVTVAHFDRMLEAVIAFDTTNNRGMELSLADLVRYWTLRRGMEHSADVGVQMTQGWESINNELNPRGTSESLVKDLVGRFWYARRGERLSKSALLRVIEEELNSYTNEEELLNLMESLGDAAQHFQAILDPSTSNPNRRVLRLIKSTNAKQHLTLLLAGSMKGYTQDELGALLNVIERVYVWYQLVGERNPGALYQRYAQWSKAVLDAPDATSGIAKVSGMVSTFMTEVGIDAAEAKELFTAYRTDNAAVIEYLLARLEIHLNPQSPITDHDDVHFSRILPQSLSNEWSGWTSEAHEVHVNRLGNMMIQHDAESRLNDRHVLADVVTATTNSTLRTNRPLRNITAWNDESIQERQSMLAAEALKLWPL
jgi:hypothetical protein